jgi:hypothetical protein
MEQHGVFQTTSRTQAALVTNPRNHLPIYNHRLFEVADTLNHCQVENEAFGKLCVSMNPMSFEHSIKSSLASRARLGWILPAPQRPSTWALKLLLLWIETTGTFWNPFIKSPSRRLMVLRQDWNSLGLDFPSRSRQQRSHCPF